MVCVVPVKVVAITLRVLCKKVAILIIVHDNLESLPPVLHLFFPSHLIKAKIIANLRMFFHEVRHFLKVVCHTLTKQEKLELLLIER